MAKLKSRHEIDMTHGGLAGKILLFAVPLMLSSLLQLLFNAADVIVVGRFVNKEALAAVGSTSSIINLLVNLFIGLSVGANVIIAHDLGVEDEKRVKKGVHTSMLIAAIGGVLLTVVGALLARQLLVWTDSHEDVIDLATMYLRIYFFGMPANMIYNFGAAILRTKGDTKRPLYILTAAGVMNVCLNLFFVIVCHMSVDGVAWATIISQYFSAVCVVACLIKDKDALHLDIKSLRLDLVTVKRILKVGIPAGLQGVVFSVSNVIIQASINSFKDTAIIAGASAAASIEGFVYVAMNAFYQTCLTFSSRNYGAGEAKRVDKTLCLCQLYVVITGLLLGGLAVLFGKQLASLYDTEPEVINQAVLRMKYVCTLYCLCGMMDTFVGVLRGVGYSVAPMLVSIIGVCGGRILWIFTVFAHYHTPEMLYISYPVSWAVTAAVHLAAFLAVRKRAYAKIAPAAAARLQA